MNLIDVLKQFDFNLFNKSDEELTELIGELYEGLMYCCHCDKLSNRHKLRVVNDEQSYIYRFSGGEVLLNLQTCKNFTHYGYLFVLDAVATIVRTQMQYGFSEFVKEKQINGKFYQVKENYDLPKGLYKLFTLDDGILMYATVEKDKRDWHSLTQFDRRAFARAFMQTFLDTFEHQERSEYLSYLDDCFYMCSEDAKPYTADELEDRIFAKFKGENDIGFLEEMELREILHSKVNQ